MGEPYNCRYCHRPRPRSRSSRRRLYISQYLVYVYCLIEYSLTGAFTKLRAEKMVGAIHE